MYDLPQKKAKKKAEAALKTASVASESALSETEGASASTEADDAQLIAVITAAVSAYMSQSGSALPFRVVSYKRARSAGGWTGSDETESF